MCVCVSERERERESECVCVLEREMREGRRVRERLLSGDRAQPPFH